MSILEICLVGLGLAADAFAVAMCKGVEMKKFILKYAVVIALFFGVFQAVMPLIGWAVASTFEEYITAYDHWIAFGLLLLLGGSEGSLQYAQDSFGSAFTLEHLDSVPALSLADGLMLLCPFSAYGTDETTTTFVSAYEAAFGGTPNQFAADAYDCVYAIYQCLQDGVITPEMSASEMCDALKTAFTSMSFSGTTGENQTWSASGEITKEPKVYQVQDGAYALVSSEE